MHLLNKTDFLNSSEIMAACTEQKNFDLKNLKMYLQEIKWN